MDLKERLKEIGAIRFGDFTLRSGKKSNYYVDLKKATCDPPALRMMAEAVVEHIPEGTDRIAGLELGSVPIAAVVSVMSDIPMVIVRKEKKGYGTGNQVEGDLEAGEKVLIIEDTTTTGGQIVKAIRALRSAGAVVEDAVVIVNRAEGSDEAVEEEAVRLISLIDASELVGSA